MTQALSAVTGKPESVYSADGALCSTDKTPALLNKKLWRAYREFSANTTIRLVATKPFYLTSQRLWTGQGSARVVVSTGGTPAGTFTAIPSQFCLNTTLPAAVADIVIAAGGTHTGGTEREVLRSDSSTAGGGSGNADILAQRRLLNAGTYYIDIVITGTTAGMYSLEWEET